jgi:hypothetical protein
MESRGTLNAKKRSDLLASHDVLVWISGCLETAQLPKNVEEGIHFRQ